MQAAACSCATYRRFLRTVRRRASTYDDGDCLNASLCRRLAMTTTCFTSAMTTTCITYTSREASFMKASAGSGNVSPTSQVLRTCDAEHTRRCSRSCEIYPSLKDGAYGKLVFTWLAPSCACVPYSTNEVDSASRSFGSSRLTPMPATASNADPAGHSYAAYIATASPTSPYGSLTNLASTVRQT